MAKRGLNKYILVVKDQIDKYTAQRRVKKGKEFLAKRPKKEDWRDVLFTNECHFYWGLEGKPYVIREQSQQYYADYIYYRARRPDLKGCKRFHVWAAVGYNFISLLIFYNAGNSNRKMTTKAYIKQILEPYVIKQKEEGYQFTLEEDNNSGHGIKPPSWRCKYNAFHLKKEKGIDQYGNAKYSPDLAPIETC